MHRFFFSGPMVPKKCDVFGEQWRESLLTWAGTGIPCGHTQHDHTIDGPRIKTGEWSECDALCHLWTRVLALTWTRKEGKEMASTEWLGRIQQAKKRKYFMYLFFLKK
jgi:hypothetical protein